MTTKYVKDGDDVFKVWDLDDGTQKKLKLGGSAKTAALKIINAGKPEEKTPEAKPTKAAKGTKAPAEDEDSAGPAMVAVLVVLAVGVGIAAAIRAFRAGKEG